ncbi:MAG: hypothetical protein H8E17_16850 [Deltaproteobacteria bacterium]|nr:hypothetical protein [Deltaproteobacteria bacterium]
MDIKLVAKYSRRQVGPLLKLDTFFDKEARKCTMKDLLPLSEKGVNNALGGSGNDTHLPVKNVITLNILTYIAGKYENAANDEIWRKTA